MNNGDQPAYPCEMTEYRTRKDGRKMPSDVSYPGLTKRERFAGMVLQGMVSREWSPNITRDNLAVEAVRQADALLAALEGGGDEYDAKVRRAALEDALKAVESSRRGVFVHKDDAEEAIRRLMKEE